jgi:hypothetical protein
MSYLLKLADGKNITFFLLMIRSASFCAKIEVQAPTSIKLPKQPTPKKSDSKNHQDYNPVQLFS